MFLWRLWSFFFSPKPVCLSCNKKTRKLFRISGRTVPKVYQALLVCIECFKHPLIIDMHVVSKNLRTMGFETSDVDLAFALIRGMKNDLVEHDPSLVLRHHAT